MKKRILGIVFTAILACLCACSLADVEISKTFTDENFRDYIMSNFDTNRDNLLSDEEIQSITSISCSSKHIRSLKGIEKLSYIQFLNCSDNKISELDVSSNKELECLFCDSNKLNAIDVSNNSKLIELSCNGNNIQTLNLKNNPYIVRLSIENNELSDLDVSNLKQLTSIYCSNNNISSLDLTNNVLLDCISCDGNSIETIKLSTLQELVYLSCQNNKLANIDLQNKNKLKSLNLSENQLASIDISNCVNLNSLSVAANRIVSLNVSNCSKLTDLNCEYNELTTLNLRNNKNIENLWCGYNKISSLDLSSVTYLERLSCQSGHIGSLILANAELYFLDAQDNDISVLDIRKCPALVECVKTHDMQFGWSNGPFCAWGDSRDSLAVEHGVTIIIGAGEKIICHGLIKHDRVEPTIFEEGIEEYWDCYECGKLYSDGRGINEISAPVIIPKVKVDGVVETGQCGPDAYYTLDDKGLLIIIGTGEINHDAFADRQDIKRVVIQEGITSIETNAFIYCRQITQINIPNSVTRIGISAFYGCNGLESLIIPGGVKDIGVSAISHCTALKRLELLDGVTSIGQWNFTGCYELTDIKLPNTLQIIDAAAFQSCYSLDSITIPDNVTYIHDFAFSLCDSLTKIIVPTCNSCAHKWARDHGIWATILKHQNIVDTPDGKYCTVCEEFVQDDIDYVEPIGKIKAFVARCYRLILGRTPDMEGMETWFDELCSGRKAAAEIINLFVNSTEYRNRKLSNGETVEILYNAMLGRGSDSAGKASWVSQMDEGQPVEVVINGFCGSLEFKTICESYGINPGSVTVPQNTAVTDAKIKAFVTRCYQIILGREPDEGGLDTWFNELVSGRKAASEIIDSFVKSDEFRNKNLSKADSVEILYKAMLGRGSDAAGKADWVSKLEAGQPLAAVINGFCGSGEFKAICDSYGIQPGSVEVTNEPTSASDEQIRAFVTRCYKIILGRDADEGGMNTWAGELQSHRKAAAEIIEAFINSEEFQNKKYSNPEAVEILYKAMLGRGSDAAGKADWVAKLNNGQPLTAIINGFCGSTEFKAICDAYGITPGSVQVQQLSSQPVVEEELVAKQTVTKTENNVTKVEIVNPSDTENAQLGTAVQAIYINVEKAKEFISRCYRCILGREASQTELDSWISQMLNGTKTADQIARGFLFSSEFKDKNVSNEELVKILYRVYMNRDADGEGLTTWTQKLDEGTSLQALLDTFAKTNEFIAVTRDMAQ